jgi:hypothetical protein
MPDFDAVVGRLRSILEPYADHLSVTANGPSGFAIEIPGMEGKPAGYVAGMRVGKSYVSYYLMAAYALPARAIPAYLDYVRTLSRSPGEIVSLGAGGGDARN